MARRGRGRSARHGPNGRGADLLARLELDENGMILDCSAAAARSLGFERATLRGKNVTRVFPQLDAGRLVSEGRVNPRLAFLCRCGVPLEGRRADGGHMRVAVLPYALRNDGALRVLLAWRREAENVNQT